MFDLIALAAGLAVLILAMVFLIAPRSTTDATGTPGRIPDDAECEVTYYHIAQGPLDDD